MIIINKSGYLKFKNHKFRCSLGKSGIGEKKIEGDNITPQGIYGVTRVYYRDDKVKKIKSKTKLFKIKKNLGWCDQPNTKYYNKLIRLPSKLSHEKLYRRDNIYDVILVLDYNMKPTIQYKGSAIFIHVARKKFPPTKGCVALSKKNLLYLTERISKNMKIKIIAN
jgi:L,D-peptidoglycan transpeptidase YkuD (ErfK/YbiS/YcfS/YnhG family)